MKKTQPSDLEKLAAPVQLTPEQLATVAAGASRLVVKGGSEDPTTPTGAQLPKLPIFKAY